MEIKQQSEYLDGEKIQTIYFGGGTPSMLSSNHIEKILETIYRYFPIEQNNEITLEANPDDLNEKYLKLIFTIGVNRLSIGIQSFNDLDLQLMRRKHTVNQAINTITEAQKVGFKNISLDLIYGLPDLSLKKWEENIDQAGFLIQDEVLRYN